MKPLALLVEDDRLVRSFARIALSAAGCEVVEFASAEDAWAEYGERAGEIALLVTDVRLPGRCGLDLADVMRAAAPGLPVLIMSGSPDPDGRAAAAGYRFLQKPFAVGELTECARLLLLARASASAGG